MNLRGVHFLLTYKCDLECDHCFVWGSPDAKGVFTLKQIRNILSEAKKLGTVDFVAVEGGEPFLFYPILVKTVEEAVKLGFRVEIISNCYWASCPEDASEWLLPISRLPSVQFSLSSDPYHGDSWTTEQTRSAAKAARTLSMNVGVNAVKYPEATEPCPSEIEGAKVEPWEIMYRGRASSKLVDKASKMDWHEFTKCPYENFTKQERVHVDPLGYVHVCQGISIGNAWQKPFSKVIEEYNPSRDPILEPLIRGGPVALVEKFSLPHDEAYADACHLCYNARVMLRSRFPETLAPDQMYGVTE